jgi:drug/metabolite transporter (DMT)-like permease
MTKPVTRDYVLLAGIGLAWGSQFLFNEFAIESISPLTTATGRICIGIATLSLVLWAWPSLRRLSSGASFEQPWGQYFLIGVFEAILPCFLLPWGQERVDSSLAAILFATIPIFTLALAPMLVQSEHWSLPAVLSVFVGFAGVVVSVGPHVKGELWGNAAGALAVLGAALSFAFSLILMRRLPDVPPVLAMRNIFLTAAPILIVLVSVLERPWQRSSTPRSWAALVALGIICGAAAYVMNIQLVRRRGPVFAALSNYIVTLVGVFLGAIVLRESLQWTGYLGLALILVALAVTQIPHSK